MKDSPQSRPQPGTRSRAQKAGQIERTRDRVLSSAAQLLARDGYRATNIERIANCSGVARSTIYRHWKSYAEVAMAAFERSLGEQMPVPDHGSVQADLRAVYMQMIGALEKTSWGRTVPAMVEAALQDADFAGLLHAYVDARRDVLRTVLERGAARGDIPPVTNVDDLLDPIVGALYYRLLLTDRPQPGAATLDRWIGQALDSVAPASAG